MRKDDESKDVRTGEEEGRRRRQQGDLQSTSLLARGRPLLIGQGFLQGITTSAASSVDSSDVKFEVDISFVASSSCFSCSRQVAGHSFTYRGAHISHSFERKTSNKSHGNVSE